MNTDPANPGTSVDPSGCLMRLDELGSIHQPEDDTRPLRVERGVHVVAGLEIPFLPEAPRHEGPGAATRSVADPIPEGMNQMLRSLHLPGVMEEDRAVAFPTFELRLVRRFGAAEDPGRVRVFFLVKSFSPIRGGYSRVKREDSIRQALDRALAVRELVMRLAPTTLTLQRVSFAGGRSADAGTSPVSPEDAGFGPFLPIGELRRGCVFSPSLPTRHEDARRWREQPDALVIPTSWPSRTSGLLGVVAAMMAIPTDSAFALRLTPTVLTSAEQISIRETLGRLAASQRADARPEKFNAIGRASEVLASLLQDQTPFETSVQVAAVDPDAAFDLLDITASEFTTRRSSEYPLARLRTLHNGADREIAAMNWEMMEHFPWGAFDERSAASQIPDNAGDLLNPKGTQSDANMGLFEIYRHRDMLDDPRLGRLRRLLTFGEAKGVWQLPRVPPGGVRGLASRAPSPFEQVPIPWPDTDDSVILGEVQYRGIGTGQEYRLPLRGGDGEQAGVSDRAIVIAGSPGSGKTNTCVGLLGQLWRDRQPSPRIPYLVIDPTRGNEFRYLLNASAAPDSGVVFTVGDERATPFCFNPFIVPRNASVQGHISRLMSCFKAAYHMWDPLPAIFELGLRRAYAKCFSACGAAPRRVGNETIPWEVFGTGELDRYPTLQDIVVAMDEVLEDQARLWGANPEDGSSTENAATIVASVRLRMDNLYQNYDHVIGGGRDRPCVDLRRLLEVPVVLEFGMIGDSEALSLLMGFLIVSAAGCIENRLRENRDKEAGRVEGRVVDRHMLVIEEAHRLLTSGGTSGGGESGNARAKAAEDLNEMLAEVRKYGQGVMMLDQRPGSLVGGVIDNAYVIAMHRLNEQKSFDQFSNILCLNQQQKRYARSELRPGEMVVLDRTSRIPVLVRPAKVDKEDSVLEARFAEAFEGRDVRGVYRDLRLGEAPEHPDDDTLLRLLMLERTRRLYFAGSGEENPLLKAAREDEGLMRSIGRARESLRAASPTDPDGIRRIATDLKRALNQFAAGIPREERLVAARELVRTWADETTAPSAEELLRHLGERAQEGGRR